MTRSIIDITGSHTSWDGEFQRGIYIVKTEDGKTFELFFDMTQGWIAWAKGDIKRPAWSASRNDFPREQAFVEEGTLPSYATGLTDCQLKTLFDRIEWLHEEGVVEDYDADSFRTFKQKLIKAGYNLVCYP